MGGALAQRWSLAHPERVRSLVLSSSFARVTHPRGNRWARFVEQPLVVAGQRLLPEATAQEVARRLARRYAWVYDPRCDDHVLAFVRHCMRATTWPQTRACLELLFTHDTRRDLGHLRVPTMVVVGERESVFARGAADELCALIPGVAFDVSPEVSHLHPLSSPHWLAQRISDWVIAHSDLD
jgi:aminoacrylate hydrolase